MDKLQAMAMFVKIAEAGSLTAAAHDSGRSLPAVVRNLADLEKALNVRLFNRTTRKIALTAEGRLYLERCQRILCDIEEAERALRTDPADPSGSITLTAPLRFGEIHISPLVTSFLKAHPRIQINLLLMDRMVDMLEEGVDLAVRIAHTGDSAVIAKPVGQIRRVVCATPKVIKSLGRPQRPEDLLQQPCVLFSGVSASGLWAFQKGGRKFHVEVKGQSICNHAGAAVDACVAGLGFGMFLSYQVMPWVERGELKIVLEQFELDPLPVNLVFHHTRLLAPRIRIFIDFLYSELKQALYR